MFHRLRSAGFARSTFHFGGCNMNENVDISPAEASDRHKHLLARRSALTLLGGQTPEESSEAHKNGSYRPVRDLAAAAGERPRIARHRAQHSLDGPRARAHLHRATAAFLFGADDKRLSGALPAGRRAQPRLLRPRGEVSRPEWPYSGDLSRVGDLGTGC